MRRIPHVALLVETSRSYGRGILLGVRRYLAEHGPWSIFVERRSLESPVPPWLKTWQGDGILTRSETRPMIEAVRKTGAPAVELRPTCDLQNPFPVVRTNDWKVGQVAASYFLENRFKHFGCCTINTGRHDHFQLRADAFARTVTGAGHACSVRGTMDGRETTAHWEQQQDSLANWISSLPKPVGILAVTDEVAAWVLDACTRAEVKVPEEAAVLGVEDDELICALTTPTLSSVRLNTPQIGYQAASLLNGLMHGVAAPREALLVDPLHVVVRQSSDILAMEDLAVRAAVQFIRQKACQGISVEQVARAAHMSRSSLERRMRTVLGRSPMAEIRRVQLQAVKDLLSDSELSLERIAEKTGFQYSQHLNQVFKSAFGLTPGDFRSRLRPHP